MKIKIDHIDKIEGHGSFAADIMNGRVREARFRTLEGARLFEGILIGRRFEDAPIISARICGICPVVHNLTAIKALENALGVKPSQEVVILRKLMEYGQIIQSHSLHLFFLSLPDFLKFKTGVKLIRRYPQKTKQALRIREFGNKLIEIIGGRSIHPLTTEVGGFKKSPSKEKLKGLLTNFDEIMASALDLENLFSQLSYPKLTRKSEFMALSSPKEYAIYEGDIRSTLGFRRPAQKFIHKIEELKRPYELIKQARFKGQSYMVGALARLNLSSAKLNPRAKRILRKTKLKLPIQNTFYNILAQSIEVVHLLEESRKLINQVLKLNLKNLKKKYPLKAGEGVGAVEAPRGTLYHYYKIDQRGLIQDCNIITPTAQMIPHLEDDLKVYLRNLGKISPQNRRQEIRMLVRAYDPCMTCSTH